MAFGTGHLAQHPLPPGIIGSLGLGGYQLLVDVAGVGAGRLGSQAFLLVAPDPDPALPDAGTQISLHQARLKEETEVAAYLQRGVGTATWCSTASPGPAGSACRAPTSTRRWPRVRAAPPSARAAAD